ncbi:hypothetical protein, partial [Escherichia coli]|uniref:hypothetical protein n=1 Tax=Escherichia coli TaxID=562 RepID=UPI0028E04707
EASFGTAPDETDSRQQDETGGVIREDFVPDRYDDFQDRSRAREVTGNREGSGFEGVAQEVGTIPGGSSAGDPITETWDE